MEADFESLPPATFLERYTDDLCVARKDVGATRALLDLIVESAPHLHAMCFLRVYEKRIRAVLGTQRAHIASCRDLHDRLAQVEEPYFAMPIEEFEAGDQCMISEPVFNDEEREMFMERTQAYKFYQPIGTKGEIGHLHLWHIPHPQPRGHALMMHGFGMDCTKHDWMKWCYDCYERGLSMLMVDFPGFGRSSGRDLQSIVWKSTTERMMFTIMDHFGLRRNVHVFADCGGAACFLTLLVAQPRRFGPRHVLIRPTMGRFPTAELPVILRERGMRLWVTWIVDSHHPVCHASFRNWNKLNKVMPEHVTLVVQKRGYDRNRVTYYQTQFCPGVSRCGDSFNLFSFHPDYKNQILEFFDDKTTPGQTSSNSGRRRRRRRSLERERGRRRTALNLSNGTTTTRRRRMSDEGTRINLADLERAPPSTTATAAAVGGIDLRRRRARGRGRGRARRRRRGRGRGRGPISDS